MSRLGPRLVIAGTHSGVGKTTVATGLMAALRQRGLSVAGAKVGPDFIDPGYHRLATGRPSRNLDVYLSGPDGMRAMTGRAAAGADLLVVEGVMGLFDGVGATTASSTAEVAVLTGSPVVLVVDAASVSASVAALIDGYDRALRSLQPGTGDGLAGVVLNRVGSDTHRDVLIEALAAAGGPPVLGVLRRDAALTWRDRHLGLVPVVEDPVGVSAALNRLAAAIDAACDLDALVAVARTALPAVVPEPVPATPVTGLPTTGRPVRIAVAGGPAFSFAYPETVERLEEVGAEIIGFDPLTDRALPDGVQGLFAGGGFPEVFAEPLSDNEPLRRDVAARVAAGLVTWAECGGLLWLARSLGGVPLCGVVPAEGTMGDRITVGYRTATAHRNSPVAASGTVLRAHEHHYSTLTPAGDAFAIEGRAGSSVAGWATDTLVASYLHLHVGADPAPVERFMHLACNNPVTSAGTER